MDDEITTYVGETSSRGTVRGHASALAERASLYADKVNNLGGTSNGINQRIKNFAAKSCHSNEPPAYPLFANATVISPRDGLTP